VVFRSENWKTNFDGSCGDGICVYCMLSSQATIISTLVVGDTSSSSSESDSSNDDPWEDIMFASMFYDNSDLESPPP